MLQIFVATIDAVRANILDRRAGNNFMDISVVEHKQDRKKEEVFTACFYYNFTFSDIEIGAEDDMITKISQFYKIYYSFISQRNIVNVHIFKNKWVYDIDKIRT